MGKISRKIRLAHSLAILLVLSSIVAIPSFVRADPGIFRITLMVPQPNSARQSWSLVVQSNLQSLGIDAGRVVLDFNTIFSRALTPDVSVVGKAYDNGGFDALFIGYALTIDADPWSLYHSSQFAPTGQNYYLWNNTQNDQLSTQIKENLNKTQRLNLVRQWQVLAQDESPSIPILYTKEIVAYDMRMANARNVFNTYHFPAWPPMEQLSIVGTNSTIILAQTGPSPGEGLNPILTTSYYDTTVIGEIFNGLYQRNDTIFKNMVPALATSYTVSSDQKTWTVNLRQGVKWTDGVDFNATDVKFTYDALQDDNLASPVEAFVKGIVGGKNNVTIVSPYVVQFKLPAPYAYFVENILATSILPEHVLRSVPYANWRTNPFNTGIGGGPIGTGPYKWVDYNALTEVVHLTRNDNFFDFPQNGKAALTARSAFQVKDYYVRHISGTDAAITAIKNGEVNILDSQYHLEQQTSFLSDWGTSKWVSYDAFGVQEIGVNMKHPILGTGTDTPLGKQDATKAALAAKYVRQAISYAVPRDLIIEQLLQGYGNPGITTPIVGNYKTGFPVTEGFNTALTPHAFNLTKSRELLQLAGYFPATPKAPSFWEAYGIYITGALVAAVVALSGLYLVRIRGKGLPPPQEQTQPSTTSPAPPTPM